MLKSINTFKNTLQEHKLFKRRAIAILIGILILSILLLSRLVYLQVFQHKLYTTLARQNQLGLVSIEPNRGLIYDRKGVLLAENKPIFNLVITPDLVKNIDATIQQLSSFIKIDAEDLKQFNRQKHLHHRFEPVPLRLKLNEEEVAKFSLERYRFPGVAIQAQMIRYYPQGAPFAAIVGYMGRINEKELQTLDPVNYSASNFIGKTGVEKYYEAQLHGAVGYQQVETNVHGQIVRILKQTRPIAGRSITLTIDSGLQKLAQQALGSQKGAIVALDPRNGEVLAFVSNPTFDPNLFVSGIRQHDYELLQNEPGNPLYNRALRGAYHPGSTIKPFISTGALLENVVTPTFTIHDAGEFQINGRGRIYHNFRRHAYGDVNLLKALTVSSDIYFYNLSLRMGIRRIYTSLKRFGFGALTDIDLPDEGSGVLPNPEWKKKFYHTPWYAGDTLNCGIGQGYLLVTPLQLAFAVSALAEWGDRWKPHVVLSWRKGDGTITLTKPQHLEPINLPQDILGFIRTAMQHVVNAPGGTAERFFPGVPYTLAGKTGTAQVYSFKNDERYDTKTIAAKLRDNSLFIAFAPVEKPTIALAIVIQNSVTPAPQIARKLLDYYLILPSPIPTITSQQALPIIVPEKKPKNNQLDEPSKNLSNSPEASDTLKQPNTNKLEAEEDEDNNEMEEDTLPTQSDKHQDIQDREDHDNSIEE
ncbi:penicillin-binding protein 2 [Candidatus Rickettsiella isopodorum]|jgi:penicillin-binding protein 2|uniref:penicillin-binding protein 2 n=1 Tax=Candidatus Rickettsiella isopodorum TaxID=1225476 RepID=UPI000A05D8D1|nr:penicillin-binding protein 2 [Candidatus Rickettsiella isopodorum]